MRMKWMVYGLVAGALAMAGAGLGLARTSCVPDGPLTLSRQFIDFVQAGELERAYLLTDRGALVGRSSAAFEARVRGQLRIDRFPTHRAVDMIASRGGFQSCGNRLRRWLSGRKVEPDQISVDYLVGPPFEIRLVSDNKGQWWVVFFQSHAM
jgi:hypothetical protein